MRKILPALVLMGVVLVPVLQAPTSPPRPETTSPPPRPIPTTAPPPVDSPQQPPDTTRRKGRDRAWVSPATARDYRAAARRFVQAAARADGDDMWWVRVAPLLSADALFAYAGFDPSVITHRAVTGPARIVDRGVSHALVQVPTDTGRWQVRLVNSGAGLLVDQAGPQR